MWEEVRNGEWRKDRTTAEGRVTSNITRMPGGLKYRWTIWAYGPTDRPIFHDQGNTKSRERAEAMVSKALKRAGLATE